MIHVIATVTLKPGVQPAYLKLLAANCVLVRAEAGCVAYVGTQDIASGISVQSPLRPDTIVICEQWESLEHLSAHLAAPHMAVWRQKVKDMVVGVQLQVTESVC